MNLSRKTHEDIKSHLQYALDNTDVELELRFTNMERNHQINDIKFKEIFKYFRNYHGGKGFTLISSAENESLTIKIESNHHLEKYRTTLNTNARIQHYCKTNKLQISDVELENNDESKEIKLENDMGIKFEIKTWVKDKKSIDISDYNLRVNMKHEYPLGNDPDDNKQKYKILSNIEGGSSKHYRFRKRFSFLSESKLFRVDLTLVRKSDIHTQTLYQSGILNQSPKYEIEVELNSEYISQMTAVKRNKLRTDEGILKIISELFKITGNILRILQDNYYLISQTEHDVVLESFLKITNPTLRKKIYNPSSKFMIGPRLISFKQKHLLEPQEGRISVIDHYTVTDKADGERHLLYIHKDNKVYLINSRFNLKYTGLKHVDAQTIMDGELIISDRFGNSVNNFMVFDIYYHKKDMVAGLPLTNSSSGNKDKTNSRMNIMKSVIDNKENKFIGVRKGVSKGSGGGDLKVILKKFYEADGEGIFKKCNEILENERQGNYPYHIDGIIFTPANLPVGGNLPTDNPVLENKRWDRLLKWKPIEETTIDFLLVMVGDIITEDQNGVSRRYKMCKLQTYMNTNQEIDPVKILDGEYKDNIIVVKTFAECYLPIIIDTHGRETVKTLGIGGIGIKEDLTDNIIVEFSYDSEADHTKEMFKWIPNRIRHDKTEQYIMSGRIEGTANNEVVAIDTRDTIQNPVTINVISGKETLSHDATTRNILENDRYYNQDADRNISVIKPMRTFHTIFVKNNYLYERLAGLGNSRLFEVACGQGGDMSRWIMNDYKMIVGIDINKDNLYDQTKGAYRRYLNGLQGKKGVTINPRRHKLLFMLMDASKKWDSKYIESIDDDLSRDFASVVFGLVRKRDIKITSLLPFYQVASSPSQKFDVVSCMFAVHYMFESDTTLGNFISNINQVMRKGGYFMGTCLDGDMVNNALKGQSVIQGIIPGKYNEPDKLGWAIRKKYTKYESKNYHKNTGKTIEVYVESINQWLEEFLVDYNLLTDKLGQVGIRPVEDPKELEALGLTASTGSFRHAYQELSDKMEANGKNFDQELGGFTEVMKEYSFLNRWFIYKKY
jgi:hypothetical protein